MQMTSNRFSQAFIMVVILMLAFFAQELPGSNVLQLALPEWPFLLVLYFSLSPYLYFSIVIAFVIGLVQDVFLGMPVLGLNAGLYTLAAFLMLFLQNRFEHINLVMQSVIIGLIVLCKLTVVTIFLTVWFSPSSHFWAFLSVPMSMLVWPVVNLFFGLFSASYTE